MDTSALARFHPSLIIGSVPYRAETLSRLLECPVPFLATNPRSLRDIFGEILLLGAVVDRISAARLLVANMRHQFRQISTLARQVRIRPRVYAEAWPHPRISSPPWVAELIALAGARMVVPAGARVSGAQVRRARPDIIVLAWTATGDRARPEKMFALPAWRSVPAIRNGRVFVVPDHLLNTPGPPLAQGLRALFHLFHPELADRRKSGRWAAIRSPIPPPRASQEP